MTDSQKETPRTDAKERESEHCNPKAHAHYGWKFARQLEREIGAQLMALQAANSAVVLLQAELTAALERAERAERALCELTPGGSEYAGDVPACVRFVRDSRDSMLKAMQNFKRRAERAKGERDEETPAEALASKLIDAWCAEHGGKISWRRCIEITAIVTKQPQAEVDRLLALGADDDGRCEMCGQSIAAPPVAQQEEKPC